VGPALRGRSCLTGDALTPAQLLFGYYRARQLKAGRQRRAQPLQRQVCWLTGPGQTSAGRLGRLERLRTALAVAYDSQV
jgi:hypothetical protein